MKKRKRSGRKKTRSTAPFFLSLRYFAIAGKKRRGVDIMLRTMLLLFS